MRLSLALALLAAFAAAAVFALPAAFGSSSAPNAKYTVTATDFKFKFSSLRFRAGTHSLTLVNRGEATHDLRIAGKKTRILNPGQRQTIRVRLKRGRHTAICTVPGHARLGMKTTINVR